MNTNKYNLEQISALADGELDLLQTEEVLLALREDVGQNGWATYHHIGDILRSEEGEVPLSAGFSARLAKQLELEPSFNMLPAAPPTAAPSTKCVTSTTNQDAGIFGFKRFLARGLAAAGAAIGIAFVASPGLMVAEAPQNEVNVATANHQATSVTGDIVPVVAGGQGALISATVAEGVVIRDSNIDEYLHAHQRFSPSVFSTAQFARSATFAADRSK